MPTDEIPTLDIEDVRGHLYWAGYGNLEDVRDLYDFEAIRAGRQVLAAYEQALVEIQRLKAANANLINNANVLAGELVSQEFARDAGHPAAIGPMAQHALTERGCSEADHPMAVFHRGRGVSTCLCGEAWQAGDFRTPPAPDAVPLIADCARCNAVTPGSVHTEVGDCRYAEGVTA